MPPGYVTVPVSSDFFSPQQIGIGKRPRLLPEMRPCGYKSPLQHCVFAQLSSADASAPNITQVARCRCHFQPPERLLAAFLRV